MIKFLKIICALLLINFVATNLLAQAGYEDVVYLKNGSVLHGIIIEQIPNQSVKIQTKDKNVFVFKMEEIEKITKEKKSGTEKEEPPKQKQESARNDEYTGYAIHIETHVGPGISSSTSGHVTEAIHAINGITLNGKFFFGGGVGFDILGSNPNYNNNGSYGNTTYLGIPFYLDIRAFPVKGNISPLLILDYGYTTVIWSGYAGGGMLFNAGFGARFNFAQRAAFNMSLNYKNQQMHYRQDGNYTINPNNPHYGKAFNLQYLCITFSVSL